ncbi:hypothetical protein ATANTOWER_013137 [Ataeniobius toweri]|uniref:Uncharacterized protein n=1 Tax=Ataeniobius toweri TaxID=208326 RepID=A0ABU7C894_9TELE|nr:hypothetical protein [Ataeniobius toweri]
MRGLEDDSIFPSSSNSASDLLLRAVNVSHGRTLTAVSDFQHKTPLKANMLHLLEIFSGAAQVPSSSRGVLVQTQGQEMHDGADWKHWTEPAE